MSLGIPSISLPFGAKRPVVNVENVVASAVLNQRINLFDIVNAFDETTVEYNPEQFPGLVFRLKKPKTATLIFSSGKMVCTGSKSEKAAVKAVHRVVDELKGRGINIYNQPEITIQNIVSSGSLPGKIDLEKCAYGLERTMYEPEQFPGLIYRMNQPKVVLLLFASGKFVCTGARKEEQVHEAVNNLHKQLTDLKLLYQP